MAVAGDKALPAEVIQQVVRKTDGIPLFVEELTKMVLETDLLCEREDHYELTGPLPPLAIPTTLHDSLMARLDRLAPVKVVANWALRLAASFPTHCSGPCPRWMRQHCSKACISSWKLN